MSSTDRRRAYLAVTALAFAVMLPALGCGFIWDDHPLIVDNPHLHDPSHLGYALSHGFWAVTHDGRALPGWDFYRPWVTLAYFVEVQLFGARAWAYHLVNLALHASVVALALRWIERRLRAPSDRITVASVAVGGALLAVHPTRVESAAWIAGSTDLWAALWTLITCELFARAPSERPAWKACAPLALACFSKELSVLVPLLLLSDGALGVSDSAGLRASWRRAWPLFVTVAVALAIRVAVVSSLQSHPFEGGLVATFTRASATLGLYVSHLAWPWPVNFLWGTREAIFGATLSSRDALLGVGASIALVALAVAAMRRASLRPHMADALWFVVPLAPVLNVVPLSLPVLGSARYLYVPLLGVAALLARSLRASQPRMRAPLWAMAGLAIVAWCYSTAKHIEPLRDERAFWEHALTVTPDVPLVLEHAAEQRFGAGLHSQSRALAARGYGLAMRERDERRAAGLLTLVARSFLTTLPDADQRSLAALRQWLDALTGGEESLLDLADVRVRTRFSEETRAWLREDAMAYVIPRAIAHARTGDLDEAERSLRALVRSQPRLVPAWGNLVQVLAMRESWSDARAAVEHALRLAPGDASLSRMREVIDGAERSLAAPARDDSERAVRRAQALLAMGAPGRAREVLSTVSDGDPSQPAVVLTRVRVEMADHQVERAREIVRGASASDPAHAAQWGGVLARIDEAAARAR